MRVSRILAISFACIATAVVAQVPESIPTSHRTALTSWLTKHPDYRAAISDDCRCSEDIKSLRLGSGGSWAPVPGYQPYLMQGDFNGDGIGDVAMVAITKLEPHKIVILTSIGSRSGGLAEIRPIAVRKDYLQSRGLFCAQPYPETADQPCKLLFGAFNSEADEVLTHKASRLTR